MTHSAKGTRQQKNRVDSRGGWTKFEKAVGKQATMVGLHNRKKGGVETLCQLCQLFFINRCSQDQLKNK